MNRDRIHAEVAKANRQARRATTPEAKAHYLALATRWQEKLNASHPTA